MVAAELSAAVGARAVSFLIADFSGHALVRLGTVVPGRPSTRSTGAESADTVDLAGSRHGDVLRTSARVVDPVGTAGSGCWCR